MNSRSDRNVRTPVLVVGGSLVGLSMSLLLAQHGLPVLTLEKHAGTAPHPRARGFHARTLELLRATPAGAAIERLGARPADPKSGGQLVAVTLAGPVLSWTPFQSAAPGLELSPCPFVYLGQDRLEPILLEATRSLGGDVRLGHELVGWTEHDTGLRAEVLARDTGERYTVEARWIVAADGARSPLRQALGIPQHGQGSLGFSLATLFSADLSEVRRERPFGLSVLTHPEAGGVLVATDVPDRYIYSVAYDPTRDAVDTFTPERWTHLLRTATGLPQLTPRLLGTFPWEAAERVAEHFSHGRVFLVGDAAHQMPPTGALGANTGIHDAANLAWKLALVAQGRAGPALLETYDRERRPVATATAHHATVLAARMTEAGRAATRDEVLSDAEVPSFGYRYGAPTPLPRHLSLEAVPGARAPHVWCTEAGGTRRSTIDWMGRGFLVLSPSEGWRSAAEAVTRRLDVPCEAHGHAELAAAYALRPGGAVLVRPDGMIAERWEDAPPDPANALRAALRAALALPSERGC